MSLLVARSTIVADRVFTFDLTDDVYNLIPGDSVNNPRVGTVGWDGGGLVLHLYPDGEVLEELPADVEDLQVILGRHGYALDVASLEEVHALRAGTAAADRAWDALAELAMVDTRGGMEYTRRIEALRQWLSDPEGQPTERNGR
jgi:hypothetical protein